MRFEPESSDNANKGLSIVRDMLHQVKAQHPDISIADLWTLAGVSAVEFSGGPKCPHFLGRTDDKDGSRCPANGRLPDASQGAQHIRDVFYRMGFNDREIVALIGAHTLGSCHRVRSGYEGPWTRNPLKFDNSFFKNLMGLEWRPKKWDGPLQFEDAATGELMMLPSDLALRDDPQFRVWAELYARDEATFFDDFSAAFAKLIALGAPKVRNPPTDSTSEDFRAAAMHGNFNLVKQLASKANVHALETNSGRSALHKAAFWGHTETVDFLALQLRLNPDQQDFNGDSPLHDAARFGHAQVVQLLLKAGSNKTLRNKAGKTAEDLAKEYEKPLVAEMLSGRAKL